MRELRLHANAVVSKYTKLCKVPMLIVGTNSFQRKHLNARFLQQSDVHLFFYPNSGSAWVVGASATPRIGHGPTLWAFRADLKAETAIFKALEALGELCNAEAEAEERPHAEKLAAWQMHWIYRCPKISLKDVLALENYSEAKDLISEAEVEAPGAFRLIAGGK